MAKIRKNLSDADMLKGFNEELSFENGMYSEEATYKAKIKNPKAPAKKEILLPEAEQERLNRFLLEISMDWIKNKKGSCAWKVTREGDQIIIKPALLGK